MRQSTLPLSRRLLVVTLSFATLGLAVPTGCDESAGRGNRVIGQTCQASTQCQAGICGGGQCLDPEIDSDADGLLNVVEASLNTDPTMQDTDADGKLDFEEVVDISAPLDTDGDGLIDALESALIDSDGDCLVDERDSLTNKAETDLDALADSACCCEGACSVVEPESGFSAICQGGEPILIPCGTSSECDLGQMCDVPPGRGRCVSVPVIGAMDGDPLCDVDSDCAAGKVCFAIDFEGTCVLPGGNPPVMPPILECQRLDIGVRYQPMCDEEETNEPMP